MKEKKEELSVISTSREIDELFANKKVSINNAFIQAREKTSLLESKIELYSQYKLSDPNLVQERTKLDINNVPYTVHHVTINASELRTLTGRSGGSLYDQMFAASLFLGKKAYIYYNKEEKRFRRDNLYGPVEYKDGILDIEFNPDTEQLLLDTAGGNFTQLLLNIAFKFQTNGGFQLYKKHSVLMHRLPKVGEFDMSLPQEKYPAIIKKYTLSEFRLEMGYVDLDQPDIIAESEKKHPDPEVMAELEKRPKFKRWNDFYSKVIEKGIEEVNEISDIYIPYIKPEKGAHGKVTGVIVCSQRNKKFLEREADKYKKDKTPAIITDKDKDEILDKIRELIPELQKTSEARSIAEAADYDLKKVEKATGVLKSQTKDTQIVPFMIKAIKENWDANTAVFRAKPKTEKSFAGDFNRFKQRDDIDFEELKERCIVNK